MKGVWGKVLKVDLTSGTSKTEELPEKRLQVFHGRGRAGGVLHVEGMPGRDQRVQSRQPDHLSAAAP